ncbi:hypothetical protein J0910_03625 [Nocardiopsis sp. CNT-189]|uniref:hypothetical protein n=1 Tax=Nocardiopsis oceanisediminis TaxID=2816862 RepID=UPI003B37438D
MATAAPKPRRIPDYYAFCDVALRHTAHWSLTYEHGAPAPYAARHKANADIVLAASRVDVLEQALIDFAPPARVRPYLPEEQQERACEQRLLAAVLREAA